MKRKKYAPFKLDCFGLLGIILLLGGTSSIFFVYYTVKEILK